MARRSATPTRDEELRRLQYAGLWLDGGVENETDALRFMRSVGFALRYNANPGLPLAAMFAAVGDKRRAIEWTNLLLARSEVMETNVVANRMVLVHAGLAPAVYALRKRNHPVNLSSSAERAFELIRSERHATAGEVRRYLGVAGRDRPDPGDLALAELQRAMLIDRGPSGVPRKGIPYLSPEGYPYRLFDQAHPDWVRASDQWIGTDAISYVIDMYLRAAIFVTPRKLATLFRLLFSEAEMHAAVEALVQSGKVQKTAEYILTCAEGPGRSE